MVKVLLFLWGLASGGFGGLSLLGSAAIGGAGTVLGAVGLLTATVAFGCAGVIEAVEHQARQTRDDLRIRLDNMASQQGDSAVHELRRLNSKVIPAIDAAHRDGGL